MIVEQPSATLGYSEEGSAPLLADHHLICKFSSPVDPNYVTVTSTLVAMVEKILENGNIAIYIEVILLSVTNSLWPQYAQQHREIDYNMLRKSINSYLLLI